jgi:hypothetical protein
MFVEPDIEWNVIATEPATFGGMLTGYAMPLVAIPVASAVSFNGLLGIPAADTLALVVAACRSPASRPGWLHEWRSNASPR